VQWAVFKHDQKIGNLSLKTNIRVLKLMYAVYYDTGASTFSSSYSFTSL